MIHRAYMVILNLNRYIFETFQSYSTKKTSKILFSRPYLTGHQLPEVINM